MGDGVPALSLSQEPMGQSSFTRLGAPASRNVAFTDVGGVSLQVMGRAQERKSLRLGVGSPRQRRFARCARGLAACVAMVLASFALMTSCSPAPVQTMVSAGDSITLGFDACGLFTACPNVSYATGT